MPYLGLSKRHRVGSARETSPALITAAVLLATTLAAGATGALAQSTSETVTRGVPASGSRDGLGRPDETTTSDATPAFANTPTPALGNPTPALGNPTPALGNPTPAPSTTPTSPVGSAASSTSTDGTTSAGVSGTTSTDDTTSVVVSTDGPDAVVVSNDAVAQPSQFGATARRTSGPAARSDANAMEAGAVVVSAGDRVANGTNAGFVIVNSPALNAPTRRPVQFTMICDGAGGQAGCKPPPRFIAVAN
jgi:hypothetical protein